MAVRTHDRYPEVWERPVVGTKLFNGSRAQSEAGFEPF